MERIEANALFNIGYGLYAITYNDGIRNNGLIVNTVIQLTSQPLKVSVTINKQNYSHDVILRTKKMNVNCLTINTPFEIFEKLGFHSGKGTDKLSGILNWTSSNGLSVLTADYINSFFSLQVDDTIDLDYLKELTQTYYAKSLLSEAEREERELVE